ncbi:MAG: ABC transporter ATP-binding protein/permease, partial [Lachnospiraceae bacterium]|nr:ABC transporter ATP-binding protein/permease [Lachnospiraceae bacterium]
IKSIYRMKNEEREDGSKKEVADGDIVFDNVCFGYETNNMVLNNVSFSINSGEKVLIEGRTGSGKSTILQLIAGLYEQKKGCIKVGGHLIKEYRKDSYNRAIYYIFQFNPIINDTVKNNLTRYMNEYDEEKVMDAIKIVKLENWMNKGDKKLETVICSEDVSQEESQLIAWAGVLLAKPKILLVDEFDASIRDETIRIIDDLICHHLKDVTIIFVSHKFRSATNMHKKVHIDAGVIEIVDKE